MDESISFLKKLGVAYEVVEHSAVFTIEEAMAEPALRGRTEIKNLFIQDDKGRKYYLVIMPGLKKLNMARLAEDLSEKKVRFCNPQKVEHMLGVKPGSVSLFCCINPNSHHVEIIFDKDLLNEHDLGFHPIVNTATVFVPTRSIHTILEALPHKHRIIEL